MAQYMQIDPLRDMAAAWFVVKMKNKTSDQIRQEFDIEEDICPNEVKEMKKEYRWSYDDEGSL